MCTCRISKRCRYNGGYQIRQDRQWFWGTRDWTVERRRWFLWTGKLQSLRDVKINMGTLTRMGAATFQLCPGGAVWLHEYNEDPRSGLWLWWGRGQPIIALEHPQPRHTSEAAWMTAGHAGTRLSVELSTELREISQIWITKILKASPDHWPNAPQC